MGVELRSCSGCSDIGSYEMLARKSGADSATEPYEVIICK